MSKAEKIILQGKALNEQTNFIKDIKENINLLNDPSRIRVNVSDSKNTFNITTKNKDYDYHIEKLWNLKYDSELNSKLLRLDEEFHEKITILIKNYLKTIERTINNQIDNICEL